jgi:HAD superfamily hydrolase (TIGR01490 family)
METPVVAAFDLDGTITDGGSVFHWLEEIAGRAHTYAHATRLVLPLTIGAIRSGRWADGAKERLFHALLAGRSEAEVREASLKFGLEHLEQKGRHHVLERVRWHLAQGHEVVIVSASPQLYVDAITAHLALTGGLGTRLGVDARGLLTGTYLGKNCRGTEKMRRLSEWIESRNYSLPPTIYAYGNSRGDRRLLKGSTYGFNLGKLGKLGALRHYPTLDI